MISGKAKLAGVIGNPISHSKSPIIHNYWLNKHHIDGVYIPLQIKEEDLLTSIKSLQKMGFMGCNVTIPHKIEVIKVVDELSDLAKKIGAVNTLVFRNDGSIYGDNTDAYGFIENIKDYYDLGEALILGAGGASRAVCQSLANAGAKKIILTNRTMAKAENMGKELAVEIEVVPQENINKYLNNISLLVNTTSLGLNGQGCPEIDFDQLNKQALVTDIVYNPLITPFLAKAQKNGNKIVDGLGMLLHQAVPGFKAWFGESVKVDVELRNMVLGL